MGFDAQQLDDQCDGGAAGREAGGNTLTLKYKDGEKTIVVPADIPVVNLVPGSRADLKPGEKVFVPQATKGADGVLTAGVILVGRDGTTPPM